ncbi:glycoside hydrolase family 3 N-terminal domain-containing protein [Paenibacillus xylanexedens]|uniref:glycoside hydrolase family 3 N-terminal domain-containing protein n=1 Tax=Paenibacillus xylanexedens TaxID=528191 RepID=UPI0011A060F6|nr:glycoside hydrolase family 3 N-terminal domain-containing protein [Paenibacillus xylanexedens]
MFVKCMTLLSTILGSMLIWAGNAGAESRFTDLQYSKWAEDGIQYMAERGTVAGYGNGIFQPEKSVTRAQAVTFMVRELYADELQRPVQGGTYSDVPTTHPFYREITIAAKNGLASGFPDGNFRPNAPISRAETAAFLTRAYPLEEGKQSANWTDTGSHWAAAPILMLSSNGLVGGYADGTYRPNRSVTRAEYAVFMSRVIRFEREQAIQAQDWDKLISYMTLSEQVGQMLMPDIRQWNGKVTTTVHEGLKRNIHDQDLGGLILFDKNIVDARQVATFTHDLQAEAGDIPLFLGIDQEGGVIKRIPGGTNLPGQMALGATGNTALAESAAQLTGEELKALGIQVNFAPVLDINSNPDNPIIGIRSFGSNADLVTRLGLAMIKGLKESGVIATVKHFPGHGDTAVDSHLGMPVLTHQRERLDAVELKPFREAINNGVDMIMTAHIAFPAIDNEQMTSLKDGQKVPVPATLSKRVLTGLLRDELGYDGLIISDAFTMKGIAEHFGENKAVERAVSAGVDIILMPQDSAAAHQTLLNAVMKGTIPKETIEASVTRILEAKSKYGLFERSQSLSVKLAQLNRVIGSDQHRVVERDIAEKAVTVLASREGKRVDSITKGDQVVIVAADEQQAQQLERQLQQSANNLSIKTGISVIRQGNSQAILQALAKADYVILASYQFRNAASEFGWSDYQVLIDDMNRRNQRYTLLSLGNPYETIHLKNVRSALAVYGKQEPNTLAGIKVLLGQLEAGGKLPVEID